MDSAQKVTWSTMLYLFADRFIPPDKALTVGIEVPCKNIKVQRKPLTAEMFAVAFHSLREAGVITMELTTKKVLFVKTTRVGVTLVKQESRPGLEGAIVANAGGEDHVKGIIRAWYGQDVDDPWSMVIKEGVDEAIGAGLMGHVDAERGAVGSLLMGKTRVEPKCEQIATLQPEFDLWAGRWDLFKGNEAQLYKELVGECGNAIQSRLEQDDND
ncbi:MAG TPA: hypothetical protein VND22_03880 [Actinomycetota bacterium]|nr:hypothetical protein [Actinomycetota bacterium]